MFLFVVRQPLLAPEASAVAGEAAVFADNAVTGDHDGNLVTAVCPGHGTHGAGISDMTAFSRKNLRFKMSPQLVQFGFQRSGISLNRKFDMYISGIDMEWK